jgi:hypothetical protein
LLFSTLWQRGAKQETILRRRLHGGSFLTEFLLVHDLVLSLPLFQLVCRLLERNISALLAAVDADSFDTIYSYSNTFNVPFITPWFPEKVRLKKLPILD